MLLITSPRFEEHVTPPGHPERMERAHVFDAVAARWAETGRPDRGAAAGDSRGARARPRRRLSRADDRHRRTGRDARCRHLHVAGVAGDRVAGGGRRGAGGRARARPPRAGVRAGPAAGPPRGARSRDGLLPLQQRRGGRGVRVWRAAWSASPSSTSTSTTATARSGCSTTIRACCTSRPISSRSTRGPARPTRSDGGRRRVHRQRSARGRRHGCRLPARVPGGRRAGARPVRPAADAGLGRLRRARARSAGFDADDDDGYARHRAPV